MHVVNMFAQIKGLTIANTVRVQYVDIFHNPISYDDEYMYILSILLQMIKHMEYKKRRM